MVIDAGAALEMLHAAALIHDDVIDGSDRRHGTDTVHVAYEARHREGAGGATAPGSGWGWPSCSAIWRWPTATGCSRGPHRRPGPYSTRCASRSTSGSTSTSWVRPNGCVAEPATRPSNGRRARRICRYKTAKYTVERPLHLGATLAAPARAGELADPLSAFGLPLGEAFQLRDDLLDVFGDPSLTGKPVGDDLREGKPTLLVSLACARRTGAGARLLEDGVGRPDLSEADVLELRAVIEATGARSRSGSGHRTPGRGGRCRPRGPSRWSRRPGRPWGSWRRFATGRDH